LSFEVFAAV